MESRAPSHYLVGSPLQLLCATETRDFFGQPGSDAHLVVFENDSPAARAQVDAVLDRTEWTEVSTVPPPSAGTRRRTEVVRRLTSGVGATDRVAFGDHSNRLMRHLAAGDPRPVLFDDGVGTRRVAALRSGDEGAIDVVFSGRHQRLRDLTARLLGLRIAAPPAVTFFSYYDLSVVAPDEAIRHSFPWLKRTFAPPPRGGAVFIGNSLVEDGLYDADRYLDQVVPLLSALPDPVVYLPHRREHETKLDRIVTATGAQVETPTLPIELALFERALMPARVTGFYSTAFHTLAAVLPDGVVLDTPELDPAGYRRNCATSAREVYRTMAVVTGGRVEVVPFTATAPRAASHG